MLPDHILVHSAQVVTYIEPQTTPAEWIEGEPGPDGGGERVLGAPFGCVLFLPGPGGDAANAYRPRAVQSPMLLFNPVRADSSKVDVPYESDLLVTAPELAAYTGAETVRWQLVGYAQPFGPPGSVIGVQATLRQVRD